MRTATRSISRPNILLPFAALLVALFATSYPANGAGIEDGFYSTSDDPSTQLVTNQNGRSLHLGQKHSPQILGATIFSHDNANTHFLLRVTIPNEKNESGLIDIPGWINESNKAESITILAVKGIIYARNGWGSNASSSELQFPFSGDNNAKDIANYFGVPITYRKNPDYNLLVIFTPSKPAFEVGEQVEATMRIQNIGSNAFAFHDGGGNPAGREGQYTFVARLGGKQVPDIGSNVWVWGLDPEWVVKPGKDFTNTVVLNKWFAFDKTGDYRILGSYHMAFERMNENNTPLQPWWEPVWEDYATAEFTVKIVPPSRN
jgi:hypothetical protein